MKRINGFELIWLIILGGYGYKIYDLIQSGDISLYMHPKMLIYLKISIIVLIILFLFQIKRVFSSQKDKNLRNLVLFLIPLVLMAGAKPDSLSARNVINKGVNLKDSSLIQSIPSNSIVILQEDNSTSNNGDEVPLESLKNKDTFMNTYNKVFDNTEECVGEKVTIIGFVLVDEELSQENNFLLCRLLMSCCAADAQVIGFQCQWEKSGELQMNQWVEITGEVYVKSYYNEDIQEEETIPVIKILELRETEEPEESYVYP